MTSASQVGVRFHSGSRITPAGHVHTTPLGYDRAAVPVGVPLPVPASTEFLNRLSTCGEVVVDFRAKLGDTLLALSAVRALTDWLRLRSASVAVRAVGPYAWLPARAGLLPSHPAAASPFSRLVAIGDRPGTEAHLPKTATGLVCDPAAPPCWATDGRAHPDLPARHYLALERRLGIRLPGEAPFLPALTATNSELVEQLQSAGWLSELTIAAVTATSWPERKDYTAERFIELAEHIAKARHMPVRLLLIGGHQGNGARPTEEDACPHVRVLRLDGIPADQLLDVFPHCRLVVGNDTGLTHLAAMGRRQDGGGPPVLGLYARHSHGKWRTGLPHHHAVASLQSERMHQGDLCPVRDVLPEDSALHMDAFPPGALARLCLDLLEGVRP